MKRLAFSEFDKIYQDAVAQVLAHWTPEMQSQMARHCRGWEVGRFDFKNYLTRSSVRYYYAYSALADFPEIKRVCDVGGLWGAFPATLVRLGYSVSMTETLRYYEAAFERMFAHVAANGVEIIDFDPFDSAAVVPGKFDAVTAMAILEHYPHSHRTFMHHLTSMIEENGFLYLEVPNMGYWFKRLGLLLGHSPLPPIDEVFFSEVPFTGHHRELTIHEFRRLASLCKMSVKREMFYNYSRVNGLPWRLIESATSALFPSTRECLAMLCQASLCNGAQKNQGADTAAHE